MRGILTVSIFTRVIIVAALSADIEEYIALKKERLGLDNLPIAPFGSTLGISPPNVPAYSCDYNTSQDSSYDSYIDLSYKQQVYTGMKWQCVEFARRWLILTKGVSFASVDFAYNIFDLPSFYSLVDNAVVPITPCRDGESKRKPEVGTLIIWKEEVDHTGHVAVVTNVGEDFIDIGEQNWLDVKWPEGQSYSRRLKVIVVDGALSIADDLVLGWILVGEGVIQDRISPAWFAVPAAIVVIGVGAYIIMRVRRNQRRRADDDYKSDLLPSDGEDKKL